MRGIFYTGLKAPTKLTAGENMLIAPQFQHGEASFFIFQYLFKNRIH